MPLPHRLRTSNNKQVGTLGEDIAASFLISKGYHILERNMRLRSGEIDIIARSSRDTLVFVEVKCRVGDRYGKPYESVTQGKLRRMSKVIQYYLLKNHLHDSKLAIEVVSIILHDDRSIDTIRHFQNIPLDI